MATLVYYLLKICRWCAANVHTLSAYADIISAGLALAIITEVFF